MINKKNEPVIELKNGYHDVPKKSIISLIFLIVFIDSMGLGITYPVFPTLIEKLTGKGVSGAAQIGGWLSASYAIMQFIFAPIVGNLSDKFGRRPILILCLAGFAVDYTFLAIAPNIQLLFVGNIIAGIFGASFTAASAYIADITEKISRVKYFGFLNAAYGLGIVIGPVIGGLFGSFGERIPFVFAAIFSFICALLVYFKLPESLSVENRLPWNWNKINPVREFVKLKKYAYLLRLLTAYLIVNIASFVVMSTWAYFTAEKFQWTIIEIGISLSVFGALIVLVQFFATNYFSQKFGNWKTMRISACAYILGMLIFAFTNNIIVLNIAMIFYCFGGIGLPALQSIFSGTVSKNEQGSIQGILTSTESASGIIGPPLMTSIFAYFTGPSAPFYFPGAAFAFAAFLMLIGLMLITIKI